MEEQKKEIVNMSDSRLEKQHVSRGEEISRKKSTNLKACLMSWVTDFQKNLYGMIPTALQGS